MDKITHPLALYLTLFISPIFLLIPKTLHKSMGRVDFYKIMKVSFRKPNKFQIFVKILNLRWVGSNR